MDINYRRATTKDLKVLYDLAVLFTEFNAASSEDKKEFFWDGWEKDFEEEIFQELKNTTSYYFIAELEDKTSIGYILAKKCNVCRHFVIDELFVTDEARGQKVGQKLLEMVIKEGKTHNSDIRVEIFKWNSDAERFYLRNGFEEDAKVLELKYEK